jgi:DEAD/DEAH box helicase domain-containing protein
MKKIVLDIETKNSFAEVGRDMMNLEISLLVIYDYEADEYTSYMEQDFPQLWPILESADMIIGWNSDGFDIPLLNKYYPGDLTKIRGLDMMEKLRQVLGHRVSLDNVAAGTLGANKIAKGLEAVAWWKEGKIDKIREYCIEDVRLTKEVYDYAMQNQHLKFKDLNDIKTVNIDTSSWEDNQDKSINMTLPI